MAQLSRTFPTNDCAPCILAPKMADLMNHKNIEVYTNAEIKDIKGTIGDYHIEVAMKPRYVDTDKCTACDECVKYCPVEVESEFDFGLTKRKAIYIPHEESLPKTYLIDAEHCTGCGVCEMICPEDCVNISYPIRYGQKKEKREFTVDCIIVATGYDLYDLSKIKEYNYGKYKNVIHAGQLERMIHTVGVRGGRIARPSDGKTPKGVAFVLCSGSRDENHCEYCSKICCMYSIKEAFLLRDLLGEDVRISIFYTDIRAAGKQFEEYYNDVRKKNIEFVRGRPSDIIGTRNDNLILRVTDTFTAKVLEEEFDMVVLAPAMVPSKASESIGKMLKLPKSLDGFFMEEHPKYKPVDTRVLGTFIAGCAHSPKDIPDSVQQGAAAAARVTRLINQGHIERDPITAAIDEELCDGCGKCIEVCPYEAISIVNGKAKINRVLCRGGGLCLFSCPVNAISINNYRSDQILAQVKAMLSVVPEPRIVGFLDDACSYSAVDLLANRRAVYTTDFLPVRVPSGTTITHSLILKTFKAGADAVYIGIPEEGLDPFSPECGKVVEKNVGEARKILARAGISENRVKFARYAIATPGLLIGDLAKLRRLIRKEGKIPEEKLDNLEVS